MNVLKKAPLGGIDRRAMMQAMAEHGLVTARADLQRDIAAAVPQGVALPHDHCVLLLGGSNGILRSLAIQLLFGEGVAVHVLHYDSERLQIGPKHAAAITEEADKRSLYARFENVDATSSDVVARVTAELRSRFAVVHVVNGIAAGAPKRYAEHGPAQVLDIDVGFDPVRQVADFAHVRALGLVDVEVATPADIEKTNRMMGTSTELWVDVLTPGKSVVAFADYDFAPDDPVYGMGPLAGAKRLQRESLAKLADRFSVVRLCYPAMNTTALSAIPGALLAYLLTADALGDKLKPLTMLARESIAMFSGRPELRFDTDYQGVLPGVRHQLANVTLPALQVAGQRLSLRTQPA